MAAARQGLSPDGHLEYPTELGCTSLTWLSSPRGCQAFPLAFRASGAGFRARRVDMFIYYSRMECYLAWVTLPSCFLRKQGVRAIPPGERVRACGCQPNLTKGPRLQR